MNRASHRASIGYILSGDSRQTPRTPKTLTASKLCSRSRVLAHVGECALDAAVRTLWFSSLGYGRDVPPCSTPIDVGPRPRAMSLANVHPTHATVLRPAAVAASASPECNRKATSFRCLLPAAIVVLVVPAQAEVAWRSVRGADVRALFVDHELADGVHYAYQFRSDGTFTGFSMGRAIRGTRRISGNEFCWTQQRGTAAEECFEVEGSGSSVRLTRDGCEAFAATLTPAKSQPAVGGST